MEQPKKCVLKSNGRVHAVRNLQNEYVASEGENRCYVETFCGRKHEFIVTECDVSCKACVKGVAKAERKIRGA